jgi:hypothetical protein
MFSKLKKWWDYFQCNILDWHKVSFPNPKTYFDGVSFHGKCERCGRRCMRDSQGNWFSIKFKG